MTYSNGDKYEGPYEKNIATGVHTVTWADGTCGSVSAWELP
jgi:hypothetical protein